MQIYAFWAPRGARCISPPRTASYDRILRGASLPRYVDPYAYPYTHTLGYFWAAESIPGLRTGVSLVLTCVTAKGGVVTGGVLFPGPGGFMVCYNMLCYAMLCSALLCYVMCVMLCGAGGVMRCHSAEHAVRVSDGTGGTVWCGMVRYGAVVCYGYYVSCAMRCCAGGDAISASDVVLWDVLEAV